MLAAKTDPDTDTDAQAPETMHGFNLYSSPARVQLNRQENSRQGLWQPGTERPTENQRSLRSQTVFCFSSGMLSTE